MSFCTEVTSTLIAGKFVRSTLLSKFTWSAVGLRFGSLHFVTLENGDGIITSNCCTKNADFQDFYLSYTVHSHLMLKEYLLEL